MAILNNGLSILTILGALALFLFGMKLMSEALQRFGGNRVRKLFSSIASNKYKAIFAGFLVTGLIQSSSAVTVMLVSFINAGFFSLIQGLGIMMGANIGTTVTAWLVTYFGFHFDFNIVLLPIMGLALPFLFMPTASKRAIGEFLLGFALLFLGLQFMKNAFPDMTSDSGLTTLISGISGDSPYSLLLFAGIGLVITFVIQSSSATIALTMVLSHNGWIGYEAAAAMVIGENIGTTITANIAAIMANRSAKRLALGHTLFNVFGALWMLIFFSFFIKISAQATAFITGQSPLQNPDAVPVGLSIIHSGFNIINTAILAGLIPYFKQLLEWIIPLRNNEKKNFRLKYFRSGFMTINEISLLQAREEILIFGKHISFMFNLIPEYLIEKRERKYEKLQKRIQKSEEQADEMELEIRYYLTRTAEQDLTEAASRKVSSMLKIIDDIESIADQCVQMEKTINRKNQEKAWFTQEMRDDLASLFSLVNEAIDNMNFNLSQEYRPGILAKSAELELKINALRDKLLNDNRIRVDKGEYTYQNAAFFNELVSQCEKLADHVINVNQAIASNAR